MKTPIRPVRGWSVFVVIALIAATICIAAMVRMMVISNKQVTPPGTRPAYSGW